MTGLGHGKVGNGRVMAPVAPGTAPDGLCPPRFDAPSVRGWVPEGLLVVDAPRRHATNVPGAVPDVRDGAPGSTR